MLKKLEYDDKLIHIGIIFEGQNVLMTLIHLFTTLRVSFNLFVAMNDPIEHATGIEKYELMAKKAGNDVSIVKSIIRTY